MQQAKHKTHTHAKRGFHTTGYSRKYPLAAKPRASLKMGSKTTRINKPPLRLNPLRKKWLGFKRGSNMRRKLAPLVFGQHIMSRLKMWSDATKTKAPARLSHLKVLVCNLEVLKIMGVCTLRCHNESGWTRNPEIAPTFRNPTEWFDFPAIP